MKQQAIQEENKRSRRLAETTGMSLSAARDLLREHVSVIKSDPDPDSPRRAKQQIRLAEAEIRLSRTALPVLSRQSDHEPPDGREKQRKMERGRGR